MNQSQPPPSRRRFLSMTGTAAATATLHQVMTGAAPATAAVAPRRLTGPAALGGQGKTVAILGAGPAGLASAVKLLEAGYRVTVLEAKGRVGGRTMTARPGDQVTEIWDDGSVRTQTCAFDPGLYLNLGAGRIPYMHQRVLDFCRKIKVPLEPYIHTTTANLFQTDKAWSGVPRQNRRIANDTRGYVADRLAKIVQKGSQADDGLTPVQRQQFLSLLTEFGRLNQADHSYLGSTRSGLLAPPTVQRMEQAIDPLLFADLLGSGFWTNGFYQDCDLHWHTTSFQPVGGMDNIWRLTAAALPAGVLVLDAPVSSIRLDGDGVVVAWTTDNGRNGFSQRYDYCLSNIPIPVLRDQVTLTGFTADFTTAVRRAPFAPACKVGWQANRRFWEAEKYQIFGGISRIDHEITQIWYPSNDYFSAKGTMTGAYNSYANAVTLGDRPHDERLSVARAAGTKLHDEMASNGVVPNSLGMSIAWHKVQYQMGAWADWTPSIPAHKNWYGTLIYPQGQDNFLVIGDQVSALPGWQEGALMSAEWAFDWITTGPLAMARSVQQVPDARELTTGEG